MKKSKTIQKECKKHGLTTYALRYNGMYRCRKCRSEITIRKRKNTKLRLVKHFGGKCVICSYSACVGALQFHHLEQEHKDFGLSNRGLTHSFEKALKEAEKCILVCANCHAEVHAGLHPDL